MYIYVMGRGHSGSTILDIAIGNSDAVESVGELCMLGARGVLGSALKAEDESCRQASVMCSCGAMVANCPFWSQVRANFEGSGAGDTRQAARKLFDYANVRNFWRTLWANRDLIRAPEGFADLARTMTALEWAITAAAGKSHLLDSNKEPTRALFLLKYHPGARVIHLVRDPRGIARSHYWRVREGRGFLFLRHRYRAARSGPLFLLLAAASWTVGNALCEMVRRVAPERVVRLRYEDLRDDPAGSVREIGVAFGLPLEDVAAKLERGEALSAGHNLGGNHIRHEQGGVRFDAGAERARPPLPQWLELATLALCWPLMRRYGYFIGSAGPVAPSGGGRQRSVA